MNDLPTIALNLRTQDARATALPIFVIQQRKRSPVPEGYSDDGEWYDTDSCKTVDDPEVLARIAGDEKAGVLDTDRYRWVWFRDEWVFVQPFFTERGAQDYIALNGHNLCEPRIYVESGWRNHEWETVREHLMSLATP